jgi:hypothetical protein
MLLLPNRQFTAEQIALMLGKRNGKPIRQAVGRGLPFNLPAGRIYGRLFDIAESRMFCERPQHQKRAWQGHDPRAGVVYSIADSLTGEIRYIGKSGNHAKRFREHLRTWRGHGQHKRTHLFHWLRSLHRKRIKPKFAIIQECLPGMMNAVEQEWIAKGRAMGWKLCNSTSGGDAGMTFNEDTKAKLSAISKAKWNDPVYRANHAANPGGCKSVPPEERAKREATRERNLAIHARNMEIAVGRRRKRELFKTLTYVTRKGAAFIPLTQGLYAMCDEPDLSRVSQHVWFANRNGGKWRPRRTMPNQSKQSMARFICNLKDGERVTHANGSALDCRRQNLAVASDTRLAALRGNRGGPIGSFLPCI